MMKSRTSTTRKATNTGSRATKDQKDAAALRRWQKVPNVGPAVAGDLIRLGFTNLVQLKGKSARNLYDRMAKLDGHPHDICLLDVFEAVISIANGNEPQPWWNFSRKRLAETNKRKHV